MKRTLFLTSVLAAALAVGCSSSDVIDLIAPDLQGSWTSQVTNGDAAMLANCSPRFRPPL